jgi:hypothetical protein
MTQTLVLTTVAGILMAAPFSPLSGYVIELTSGISGDGSGHGDPGGAQIMGLAR